MQVTFASSETTLKDVRPGQYFIFARSTIHDLKLRSNIGYLELWDEGANVNNEKVLHDGNRDQGVIIVNITQIHIKQATP